MEEHLKENLLGEKTKNLTDGEAGIQTNKTMKINLKILEWSEGSPNRLIILANIKFKA